MDSFSLFLFSCFVEFWCWGKDDGAHETGGGRGENFTIGVAPGIKALMTESFLSSARFECVVYYNMVGGVWTNSFY